LIRYIKIIMDSSQYQQIKNQNLTGSARNLIMGSGWIFHQDNNPKQTSKLTQKCITCFSHDHPIEDEWDE